MLQHIPTHLAVAVLFSLLSASVQAQAPDARKLNDSANITGEVSTTGRAAKHRLRIVFRQGGTQELSIEAANETVFANMQAAYVAYRNKDSASKDFAVVSSPSGWVTVVYWPDVVSLHRWSERP
jgi:hypothetical protein